MRVIPRDYPVYLRYMENPKYPELSAAERCEEIAEVLAECIVYLGERGLLEYGQTPSPGLPEQPLNTPNPNVTKRP